LGKVSVTRRRFAHAVEMVGVGGGDEESMKIPRKRLLNALRKIQAAREELDKVREEVFVKQCVYEQMDKISDWMTEVEGLLGRGRI
jgi:hypothetical protein